MKYGGIRSVCWTFTLVCWRVQISEPSAWVGLTLFVRVDLGLNHSANRATLTASSVVDSPVKETVTSVVKSSSSCDVDRPSRLNVMDVLHFDGEETSSFFWQSSKVWMSNIDLGGFVRMNKKISSAMNSQLDCRSNLVSMKTCEQSVQPSDESVKASTWSTEACAQFSDARGKQLTPIV